MSLPGDATRRRIEAHEAGRHVRPQVDCVRCWNAGHFEDLVDAKDELIEDEPLPPAPIHDGRHGPQCLVCAPVL